MKKLFFTLILVLSAAVASAEVAVKPILEVAEGDARLALIVDEDGNANFYNAIKNGTRRDGNFIISVYDDDFTLIKRLEFKGFSNIEDVPTDIDMNNVIVYYNWMVANKWCAVMYQNVNGTGSYVIVDEDGNIHGDFPLKLSNCYITLGKIFFGKPYLRYEYYDVVYGETVWYNGIYTFTGSNSVEAVKVAEMKAYPNPLPGGQVFTVELPREADSHTFLVVTDMNGRQVERRQVEAGAGKAVLSHVRLGRGQYIYTVIYGDDTCESGKLLAE